LSPKLPSLVAHYFLIFLIGLFVNSPKVFAEKPTTFQSFKSSKSIEEKTRKALELWEYYLRNDVDSLQFLAAELATSKKRNSFSHAVSKRIFGCFQVRKGKILEGIKLLKESKNYFLSIGDMQLLCEELNELGIAYYLQGDLETAAFYFKSSLTTGAQSPKESDAILAEVNLAKVYIAQKNFKQATAVLNHYIFTAKELKKWEAVANAYSVLADVNLNLEKYELAKSLCKKQLKYAKKGNALNLKINALNNQALIFYFEGNPSKALVIFHQILSIRKKQDIPSKIYDAYYNLASYYVEENVTLSNSYMDSCILMAEKGNYLFLQLEALRFKRDELKQSNLSKTISSLEKQIETLNQANEKEREELTELINREITPIQENNLWSVFGILFGFLILVVLIIRYLSIG
jgi:tetratricopeptide (TPR) repeat protein